MGMDKVVPPDILRCPCHLISSFLHQAHSRPTNHPCHNKLNISKEHKIKPTRNTAYPLKLITSKNRHLTCILMSISTILPSQSKEPDVLYPPQDPCDHSGPLSGA